MRIFISYPDAGRKLARQAKEICNALGHKCFIAAEQAELLVDPQGWFSALIKQIDLSDVFVLCLNTSSLKAWIQRIEWHYVCTKPTPQKIVLHEGEWDPDYEDNFSAVKTFQYFRIDDEESLRAFKRSLPMTPPEEARFSFMQRLVIEAGTQLTLRYGAQSIYGAPHTLDLRKNPATDVDILIQDQIVSEIRKAFPDDGIIAEERKGIPATSLIDRPFVWVIDPLDGTLNYMAGDERFCCGIGLLSDGKPFMGAIFVPSSMELYSGGVGRQAQCYSLANSTVTTLNTDKSIDKLSNCRTLSHINSEQDLVDICFENNFPYKLHKKVRRVWMWGCGLLSLLSVAKGGHHLFVQRVTYPHDIVPGLAILESAGGAWATLPTGTSLRWDPSEIHVGIVAACSEEIRNCFLREFSFNRD